MFRPADDILIEHNDIKAYTFFTNTVHEFLITLYCAGDKIEKIEMGGGHVALWRKGEVCTRFWWGNLMERDHLGDQDVDGKILLRWILRKWEGVEGTGWSRLRIGSGGGRL